MLALKEVAALMADKPHSSLMFCPNAGCVVRFSVMLDSEMGLMEFPMRS